MPDCRDEPAVRALLARLYASALGRAPSPSEVNLWLFTFSTQCDIASGVRTILNTEEYLSVPRTLAGHVAVLYRSLLAREPGPDEVAGWLESLAAPFIEDQFLDGPEFADRWRPLTAGDP